MCDHDVKTPPQPILNINANPINYGDSPELYHLVNTEPSSPFFLNESRVYLDNELVTKISKNFEEYLKSEKMDYSNIMNISSKFYTEAYDIISSLNITNNITYNSILNASFLSVIVKYKNYDVALNHILKNIDSNYKDQIKEMLNFIRNNIDNNNHDIHKNINCSKIPFYIYNLDKMNDYNIIEYLKTNDYNIDNLQKYIDKHNFLEIYNNEFKSSNNKYHYRMYIITELINYCKQNNFDIKEYIDNFFD